MENLFGPHLPHRVPVDKDVPVRSPDRRIQSFFLPIVLTGAIMMACGGPEVIQPVDPQSDALERCRRSIRRAITSGQNAEEAQQNVAFQARFNPAACACPGWEIRYRGQWERVAMQPTPEAQEPWTLLTNEALTDLEEGGFGLFTVLGSLSNETERAETGVSYRVFLLSGVDLP